MILTKLEKNFMILKIILRSKLKRHIDGLDAWLKMKRATFCSFIRFE